jgi:mono/diheme cytochrome c family protein
VESVKGWFLSRLPALTILAFYLIFGFEFARAGEALPVRFLDAASLRAPPAPNASISALPLKRLRVWDPYEQTTIEFEGYGLGDVLDQAYGKAWRTLEATHQLRMKCRDGYRLSVPLSRVLKHEALLAIRRVDAPGFTLIKKDVTPHKQVDLSPAYLVWENELDRAIRAEGDYGWPFQWAEASLEKLGEGDSLLLPKKGSSLAAVRGYSHFKVHCQKCHSIEGEGGKVGPELHSPKNVTRYWRTGMVEAWILNPAAFRVPNSMPPLAPAHPDRKRIAQEIVEYLSSLPESKGAR